jgi:ribosomal protein S18 acetylase RimI-like enzyme
MAGHFVAEPATGKAVAELSALLPQNAFATGGYFEARKKSGDTAWLLGMRDTSGTLQAGCGAFIRTGQLNTRLEIISLPPVTAHDVFWDGLRQFCREHHITKVELGSSDSNAPVEIPAIGSRFTPIPRAEYVLDVTGDVMANLSTSHRQNVRRGQRSGLELRRTRSMDGARTQLSLMNQSMDRRRNRGEPVDRIEPSRELLSLLETGAAEIFQAVRDGVVLSSVVVLRAAKGAYSYYAGTSPAGMKVSASHFLNFSIAMELRAEGVDRYNLGGAPIDSSLAAYKDAFGATRVPLMAATAYVGPAWRRKVTSAIELYRADPEKFRRLLTGDSTTLLVYAAPTSDVAAPSAQPGLEFRALSAEDLRALRSDDPSFRARQLTRLERFGESLAYGVFVDGQIGHVSWLLPKRAMHLDLPHVVRANDDEAEITGCETLPAFRGRGIYGFAIAHLSAILRAQGKRRVFMKTRSDNIASQAGIEKAGLKLMGSATVYSLPVIRRTVLRRRFR